MRFIKQLVWSKNILGRQLLLQSSKINHSRLLADFSMTHQPYRSRGKSDNFTVSRHTK